MPKGGDGLDSLERQALIARITAEVCRAVDAAQAAKPEAPDTLAIISAPLALPDRIFKQVRETFGGNVRYLLFGDHLHYAQVPAVQGTPEGEQDYIEEAAGVETVLLLSPRTSTLSRLAKGEDEGLLEDLVLRTLLWGKDVHIWLDFQPMRFKRNTFFEKVLDAIEALEDMGVTVTAFDWTAELGSKPLLTLVTERDMMDAGQAGAQELRCASNAIITPSALDKAAELNIRIVRV